MRELTPKKLAERTEQALTRLIEKHNGEIVLLSTFTGRIADKQYCKDNNIDLIELPYLNGVDSSFKYFCKHAINIITMFPKADEVL